MLNVFIASSLLEALGHLDRTSHLARSTFVIANGQYSYLGTLLGVGLDFHHLACDFPLLIRPTVIRKPSLD